MLLISFALPHAKNMKNSLELKMIIIVILFSTHESLVTKQCFII